MSKQPSVSIGIPVLNEALHIEDVIRGFLNTRYENLVEIMIADGGSTDGTREIISTLSTEDSRVKLIINEKKYQSFALNKMIDLAEGDIFLRADGHGIYAHDYVEQCAKTLVETGAKNVGGAQRYLATNKVQAGVSLAMKSFFGSGNAKYKREDYEGYAETVFLGCFWTKDLKEIGGFNPENITSQDLELNLRLKEKYGECVYVSPRIVCHYFPRSTFSRVFKQYFKHARGRLITILLHPGRDHFRGFVPSLFLITLLSYFIVDQFWDRQLFSIHIILFLFSILVLESVRVSIIYKTYFREKVWVGEKPFPGIISGSLYLLISMMLMQSGHFLGFMYQLVRSRFGVRKEW